MSTTTLAGLVLIAMPIAFNALFALLGMRFDYPDILRRPTAEVLARFREGGTGLVLLWWAFALSALAFAPLVVLVSQAVADADGTLLALATTVGVLAAIVQFLGLIRWPFLVPYLARVDAEAEASPARREAVDVVFQAFNRYLGVAVGEHLGYGLTGAWSVLTGAALTQTAAVPSLARHRGNRRRRGPHALLAGVRRALRAGGLGVRGQRDALRLHRVVALADRHGRRADRL